MNTAAIRRKFLDFFGSYDHHIRESASLVPHDDPTLLFTSAGMAPFKPYFLGLKTDIRRAASCQKCFRTTDIENVGYTARHHTFFEMLGNFSFGDYFKKDAIAWAWEFITKDLNLDVSKLYVSVHHSDDEAREIWLKDIGVPADRIVKLGDKDNFWTIGIGPSGPCSEIYYDQGEELSCGDPKCAPGCDCARYLEFWNLVFTQYNRDQDGNLTPLEKRNIDTGMGLERLASILQGKFDNYENDVFSGIVKHVEEITGFSYGSSAKIKTAIKVTADHVRALAFAIADGALPGNEGRGYVLRKILRRASRFGFSFLAQDKPFLHMMIDPVVEIMHAYKELEENKDHIKAVIKGEEERFLQTLRIGTEILADYIDKTKSASESVLSGENAFLLHDTYGFPLDLTCEICREAGMSVDRAGFDRELEKQRERGRANVVSAFVNYAAFNPGDYPATGFTGYEKFEDTGTVLDIIRSDDETMLITDKTPFYAESGGQTGDSGVISSDGAVFKVRTTEKIDEVFVHIGAFASEKSFSKGESVTMKIDRRLRSATMRNHTATHLLHKTLRNFLGSHVKQAGSLVAPDRLRFDFTHFEALPHDIIAKIEDTVNEKILEGLEVKVSEMKLADAVSGGAMALFGEKYGDIVRMIQVGDYSKELCGGTHLKNSAQIGMFSIVSESSAASGIRRIEAITGEEAYRKFKTWKSDYRNLTEMLECDQSQIVARTEKILSDLKEMKKEFENLRKSQVKGNISAFRARARKIGDVTAILERINGLTMDEMKELSDELLAGSNKTLALIATDGEKAGFVLKISKDLVERGMNAGKLIREIAKITGGGGGGRPDMATAGGKDLAKLDAAINHAETLFRNSLEISG